MEDLASQVELSEDAAFEIYVEAMRDFESDSAPGVTASELKANLKLAVERIAQEAVLNPDVPESAREEWIEHVKELIELSFVRSKIYDFPWDPDDPEVELRGEELDTDDIVPEVPEVASTFPTGPGWCSWPDPDDPFITVIGRCEDAPSGPSDVPWG